MKRTRATLKFTLPTALIAALAITGCSAGGDSAANCAPEGAASKAVQVEGDFGAELTLTSETPAEVTELERSVLIQGEGEEIASGTTVNTSFTVFNGKTGEVIAPSSPSTMTNDTELVAPWAAESITCASIGDRVVTVVPALDVFGEGGAANYELEDTDALIAVFDFTEIATTRAEGKAVDAPEGFPTVELAENGAPTITIPEGEDAPSELKIATLIEGEGEEVGETDTVTLQYTGVVWSSGKVFDSSWESGAPLTLPANQFVPGFTKAITGQKVGSQVIAMIPAEEGYGEDTAERLSAADATKDDVMVFVVDILSATPAA